MTHFMGHSGTSHSLKLSSPQRTFGSVHCEKVRDPNISKKPRLPRAHSETTEFPAGTASASIANIQEVTKRVPAKMKKNIEVRRSAQAFRGLERGA